MCADCNVYDSVPVVEDVPKFDCTMCRHYLPCQKESGKTDDIICEKFDNLFPIENDDYIPPVIEDDDIPLPADYDQLPEE